MHAGLHVHDCPPFHLGVKQGMTAPSQVLTPSLIDPGDVDGASPTSFGNPKVDKGRARGS